MFEGKKTMPELHAKSDLINHPPHYKGKGMEVIEVIQAFGLGYNLGNVVKYILRAGKRGRKRYEKIEDLKEAQWYLNIEIQREEKYHEAEKTL